MSERTDEACRMAILLATRQGYAVFPCSANKTPTRPKRQGGHGFEDATKRPEKILWLWERWPGPLIGIATGKISGITVLDVDSAKHPEALEWWQRYYQSLLPTRVYQTLSGGFHC